MTRNDLDRVNRALDRMSSAEIDLDLARRAKEESDARFEARSRDFRLARDAAEKLCRQHGVEFDENPLRAVASQGGTR
jgi:hypothetical protein